MESRRIVRLAMSKTENRMPATAAARGEVNFERARVVCSIKLYTPIFSSI